MKLTIHEGKIIKLKGSFIKYGLWVADPVAMEEVVYCGSLIRSLWRRWCIVGR